MPADCAMRAMRTAFLAPGFGPVRIFSVTGTSTARTTASRIAATSGSLPSSADPGRDVAHFPGRAAHVDVDDLRAQADVVARGLGHGLRIGPRDLYRDRVDLAGMVGAEARFPRLAQFGFRRHHFRHGEACAEALAQLAKRAVRDARHRGDDDVVRQKMGADAHDEDRMGGDSGKPWSGRQL